VLAKGPGAQRNNSVASALAIAPGELQISGKDALKAFTYLKDHPNASAIREEASAILADPKATEKLLRKLAFTIDSCFSPAI